MLVLFSVVIVVYDTFYHFIRKQYAVQMVYFMRKCTRQQPFARIFPFFAVAVKSLDNDLLWPDYIACICLLYTSFCHIGHFIVDVL